MNKRNIGMHTSAEQAKRNILTFLEKHSSYENVYPKSSLGHKAFPNYNFKAPQGAAFSVAKIVRQLDKDGLISARFDTLHCGHYITQKGIEWLKGGAA